MTRSMKIVPPAHKALTAIVAAILRNPSSLLTIAVMVGRPGIDLSEVQGLSRSQSEVFEVHVADRFTSATRP
jgi:hypothetical protein